MVSFWTTGWMVYALLFSNYFTAWVHERTYLVNVVVNMLASHDRCYRVTVLCARCGPSGLELSLLLLELRLEGGGITVMVLAVLYGGDIVMVGLR